SAMVRPRAPGWCCSRGSRRTWGSWPCSESVAGSVSSARTRCDARQLASTLYSVDMAKAPRTKSVNNTATTASVQDYLASIYDLISSGKPVIGARLAKHMGISAPAVTESIHRLTRGGYVKVGPGKTLILTPKGREIAEVMARRHRLLERWLTDSLGLNWTDAHEEAHRLEHALSPRVEERLAEMLGMPSTCPHGNPIPGMA